MAKDHKVTPEDSVLFRESAGQVRRLHHDRADITPRKPRTAVRHSHPSATAESAIHDPLSDEYQPHDDHHIVTGMFARPGLQQTLLRKLRRGHLASEAELDLHGLTVSAARSALLGFLQQCQIRGVRHVRIIHGQGNSSRDGKPVLRGKVTLWLQQLPDVLAFAPARPEHGGNGALYLLLKLHQK